MAAEVPGPASRFAPGAWGSTKAANLLDWEAAEPLWAPGLGPRHECPQVIRHQDIWYLFNIQRQDQYRVAKSLAGPWLRPPSPYLGPHTVLAGSHVDVRRNALGQLSLSLRAARAGTTSARSCKPRCMPSLVNWTFMPTAASPNGPSAELIQAMHALPPVSPLAKSHHDLRLLGSQGPHRRQRPLRHAAPERCAVELLLRSGRDPRNAPHGSGHPAARRRGTDPGLPPGTAPSAKASWRCGHFPTGTGTASWSRVELTCRRGRPSRSGSLCRARSWRRSSTIGWCSPRAFINTPMEPWPWR